MSLYFYFNENVFISPSFLKDISTGHRILWQLFSFSNMCMCIYIYFFHYLLAFIIYFERSTAFFFCYCFKGNLSFFSEYNLDFLIMCQHFLLWLYLFCLGVIGLHESAVWYLSLVLKIIWPGIFKYLFYSILPLFSFWNSNYTY